MARKKPTDEALKAPAKPVLLKASKGAVVPPDVSCDHDRHEAYDATRPNGERVQLWRCLDCGAYALTPLND